MTLIKNQDLASGHESQGRGSHGGSLFFKNSKLLPYFKIFEISKLELKIKKEMNPKYLRSKKLEKEKEEKEKKASKK